MNEANPAFVGALVAGLAGLLGLAVLWKKFNGAAEARTVSPQPLRVQQEPKFTEAPDCATKHSEVDARIQAVEERANASMRLIREELAQLRKGSDYLQRRVNGMSGTLYLIAGKLGIVPAAGEPGGEG